MNIHYSDKRAAEDVVVNFEVRENDAILRATADLAPTIRRIHEELVERGDDAIRRTLAANGVIVVRPGREVEEWVAGDMGECSYELPGGGWCREHGGYLPSNRTPPYCDEVLDVIDKIERFIS